MEASDWNETSELKYLTHWMPLPSPPDDVAAPAEQAAPKAAPGMGNSGFDHQTAADFLSGKTVNDEAVRKFVAASRWAHDEKAALRDRVNKSIAEKIHQGAQRGSEIDL